MKEIIISDINFLEPEKDTIYSSNIIRNLLGNYYFVMSDSVKQNYLFSKDNSQNTDPKTSLINALEDAVVSWVKSGTNELVTINFRMNEWNKVYSTVTNQHISNLETVINNNLKDLYYYGISKNINGISPADKDYVIKQFGKHFYDYCFTLQTPSVLLPSDDPSTKSLQAKIEPLYNFFNKEFENVASNNPETSLYNFYALNYYLLENLEEPAKADFLQNNVLPLLQKYDTFATKILPQDILKELDKYKNSNPKQANKKTILVKAEALKMFNDIETQKEQQPYGIEISFNPSPQKVLNTLLKGTSGISDLENFILNENFKDLSVNNFVVESEDGELGDTYKLPTINLNDWIKSLETTEIQPSEQNIIFTKKVKNKDSSFLKKIKKTLLQKKIVSLIQNSKRSFMDIVAGVPAYNEVALYEIKKYDINKKLLQHALIPNTEDIDFYKYFDTQVKYNTQYRYEVMAWTLVIGNKYKFFDRVEIPPKKKTIKQLKNNAGNDSEFFRWFRIAYLFSKMYTSGIDVAKFLADNEKLFGETKEKLPGQSNIIPTFNFSKALYNTYNNNIYGNNEYNSLLNSGNYQTLAKNLIDKTAKSFSIKFANLLTNSFLNKGTGGGADVTNVGIIYETFRTQTGELPADIIDSSSIKEPYYSKSVDYDFILEDILKLFNKAGILINIDFTYLASLIAAYGNATQLEQGAQEEANKQYFRIANYLEDKFNKNIDLFLNGGFITEETTVDLSKEPNYGLDKSSPYYPRFYVDDKNSKLTGKLQFGVINEVDIALIAIPYVNPSVGSPSEYVKVISSPPPPPEVVVLPYKNVSNKIKFFLNDSYFTYRDFPIPFFTDDPNYYEVLLKNEKYKDGKLTFRGDEPSAGFFCYKMDKKPLKYEDFKFLSIEKTVLPNLGGFEDMIEPNKKYYYMFASKDFHNMVSNPSPVYEIEMVENSGAIYPIINIFEFEQEDVRTKTKSVKEKMRINVNNPRHILLRDGETFDSKSVATLDLNKFGMEEKSENSLFNKKFKIRITSKSSKKKIDINLSFNKNVDLTKI